MSQTDRDPNAPSDWSQLAKEALDIWQNHLTSLAADPKAKEEMTRFLAPMSQMFASWTNMMQQSMMGAVGADDATPQDEADAFTTPQKTAPTSNLGPEKHEHDTSIAKDVPVAGMAAGTAPSAALPPESGQPVSSERARNLAELADRLAVLERELEDLQIARAGQREEQAGTGSFESLERVAGADKI